MSLVVWLPMTKDLRQQGLSDVTVVNNGATFNSSGKLGGCYSFGTGDSYITIDSTPLKTFTEFSFACWVKIISWNTSYSTIFAAKNGTGVSWNNLIFSLLRNSSNSTLCFNISNGSNYTTTNCQTDTLSLNTWYHITCTYKSGEIKLYQDGNVVSTYKTTVIPNFNSIVNLWIGKSNASSYQSNNLMNDVRIYDHCLSPMEVKRISQGLVLHYPLNRMGFGQENLAKNSNLGWNSTTYNVIQGEMYEDWVVGDTYTITIKGTPSSGCKFGLWSDAGNAHMCYFYNKIKDNIWIATAICSASQNTAKFSVWDYPSNNPTHNAHIEWIKIEKGSIATPWLPAPSDNLATQMGLNSNIEYDTSGYCNNGTRTGTFDWTSNTPKYSVSTQFNGTQYIQIPFPCSTISEAVSVAVWGYESNWNTSSAERLIGAATNSSGWCIGDYGSENTLFAFYANGGYNVATGFKQLSTGWHHFVITFDGLNLIYYVDGQQFSKKTFSTKQVATGNYNINIGRHYGGGYNFKGNMSDVRIYATALSATDVKSLYQNSAYIDSSGNIYGAVHSEV